MISFIDCIDNIVVVLDEENMLIRSESPVQLGGEKQSKGQQRLYDARIRRRGVQETRDL